MMPLLDQSKDDSSATTNKKEKNCICYHYSFVPMGAVSFKKYWYKTRIKQKRISFGKYFKIWY